MVDQSLFGSRPGLAAQIRDLDEILSAIESRREQPAGLWQRESMTGQLRAAAQMLGKLPDPAPFSERIDALQAWLADLDRKEMAEPRERLAAGSYKPDDLRRTLEQIPGYLWDPYVRRIFEVQTPPIRATACEPLMVDNVPTNFQTILEVADRFGDDDVLFDIGAGVGTVVVILAFLTGRRIRGVEVDPAYAAFAAARAKHFRLDSVEIIEGDARKTDYREGTVFYLYDPFRGAMMTAFLKQLHKAAKKHPITVLAFGQCHRAIAEVDWLTLAETTPTSMRVFRSS